MDYTYILKTTNNCNLRCKYCYHFLDGARKINESSKNALMNKTLVHQLIKKLLQHNQHFAHFIWHGGEPLLLGKDFYEYVVEVQKQENTKNLKIRNSIQSNGVLLDKEWIDFFKTNDFSVGISLDGDFDLHASNRGTTYEDFCKIIRNIELLKDRKSKFGLLIVVSKASLTKTKEVFDFFAALGVKNMRFLPCFIADDQGVVDQSLSITPKEYGQFLSSYFDIWINSGLKNIHIGNFYDFLRFTKNMKTRLCVNCNGCDDYLTVTPNGNFYICDNFAQNDENFVGNVNDDFADFENSKPMKRIRQCSKNLPIGCEKCEFFQACKGGCKFHRWLSSHKLNKKQYYCATNHLLYKHMKKTLEMYSSEVSH